MNEIATTITVFSAVSIVIVLVLALALYLFSNWVMKPIDLSTKKTGHKGFDDAQRQCDALDLELGIMEELEGDPTVLNALQDKLAIAKTTRDIEQENLLHQLALSEASETSPEEVPVAQPAQKVTN